MILDFLIQPVTGIISDVIKRVLPPEKVSETDRLKLEHEVTLELMKMDASRFEKEIEDRVSARELAAREGEKGNALSMSLAALHRPIWSLGCFALFAYSLTAPTFGLKEIVLTDIHQNIMMTVIIFYFGGRTWEKLKNKI